MKRLLCMFLALLFVFGGSLAALSEGGDGAPASEPPASGNTEIPVTDPPAATTETPAASTETPTATTETPTASTETPTASTETPAANTETPAASTETPAASTETPAANTETPAASTETPAASTETPAASTETPDATETPLPTEEATGEPVPALTLAIPLYGVVWLAEVLPEDLRAQITSLRWVSSDPTIAEVSGNGSVLALAMGSCVVSAYQEGTETPVFALAVEVGDPLPNAGGTDGIIHWDYNNANGALTLTGNGAMNNYASGFSTPWAVHMSNITTVIVGSGVTSIGNRALQGFTSVTSITLPDSVTSIGTQAFEGCTALTFISIPPAISTIETSTFSGCTALTSVAFRGNSLNTVGQKAFYRCSALTAIALPNNTSVIHSEAFAYCSSATSISLPVNISNIAERTFIGCSSVTSVVFPQNVVTIHNSAFEDCTRLNNLTFMTGITGVSFLGNSVFRGCTALSAVAFPSTLVSMGTGVFQDCTSLTAVSAPGLSGIEADTFNGCTSLSNLPLYGGITYIEDTAFRGCTRLQNITLPAGLTYLGTHVFEDCSSLSGVSIPNTITTIPDYTFSNCSSLGGITLPTSITTIGEYAFRKSGLYALSLPSSVTTVGYAAFEECVSLSNVYLPDSVSNLNPRAFASCAALTTVRLPANLTVLNADMFNGCRALSSIPLPASLVIIKTGAFDGCASLTEVYPGPNLVTMEPYAYRGCTALRRIDLPDSLPSIPYGAFMNCTSLTNVVIPQGVTSIDDYAFSGIGINIMAFMGNAPSMQANSAPSVGTFKYLTGRSGFTAPTWRGRPCVRVNDPTGFVTRLYTIVLARAAEPSGVVFWRNALLFNLEDALPVVHGFLMGPEFLSKSVSDTNFVQILYRTCMDRMPDSAGQNFWVNDRLGMGVSRLLAFKEFAKSAEFKAICAGYGIPVGTLPITEAADENIDVTMYFCRLYDILLDRYPDRQGLNFWTNAVLHNGITGQAATHGYFYSVEFQNAGHTDTEYVKRIYRSLLDRAATPSDIAFYLNEINLYGRDNLFYNFTNSPEFKTKMKTYGIR